MRHRGSCVAAFGAALVAAACGAAPGARAPAADYSRGTHVVLLGTGTPNADPDRSGPALAIVANDTAFLVDAGPGIVRRAAAAARRGVSALDAPRLTRVFITHLHSDHTTGLPDLVFTPWVLERAAPLDVWGPPGIEDMAAHIEAAWAADVRRRIDGLQPQNATGWEIRAHVVMPGIVYRDANVTVSAFAVPHEEWPQAFGYRFETPDRVIVVSGDTRASDAVVDACAGCDVLVHEVYSDAGFAGRAPEWRRYHAQAHTSATELAALATRARPGLLVLTHQLLWGASVETLLAEIRAGYDGAVVYGNDLDIF